MALAPVQSLPPGLVLTRPDLGIRINRPVPPPQPVYDIAASGGSTSAGSAEIGILMAIAATGASTSSGSAALAMLAAISATGNSSSAGSGALLLILAIQAAGGSISSGLGALLGLMAIAATGGAVSAGSGRVDLPTPPPLQDFEEARLAMAGITTEVRTF